MTQISDRIERQVELKAPVARVWRALTNAEEFGNWFGVKLVGKNFVAGEAVSGPITYPGYEHVMWDVVIERMEPERLFSFRWHPFAIDQEVDFSDEPTTLVEFTLEETEGGTLLRVVESGFDNIPPSRRLTAFRMNSGGWDAQMENIQQHVEAS